MPEKRTTRLFSHNATMALIDLMELSESNRIMAAKFKREENTPMNRYHHGYCEGLLKAIEIVKERFGE